MRARLIKRGTTEAIETMARRLENRRPARVRREVMSSDWDDVHALDETLSRSQRKRARKRARMAVVKFDLRDPEDVRGADIEHDRVKSMAKGKGNKRTLNPLFNTALSRRDAGRQYRAKHAGAGKGFTTFKTVRVGKRS